MFYPLVLVEVEAEEVVVLILAISAAAALDRGGELCGDRSVSGKCAGAEFGEINGRIRK